MKFSLYHKLAMSLAGIFILIASLFIWWTQALSQVSRAQAEQQLHLGLAEHLVGDNPLLKQGVYDYEALENLFHTLMILGPSFEFYFIDPSGKLLTYSAKPGEVKRQHIDLVPLIKLIERPQHLPIYGDDPRNLSGEKIFSVAPVYNEDTLQGYLYVIIGSKLYDSIISNIKSNDQVVIGLSWLGLALGFLLTALLLLFRYLTRPVAALTEHIKQLEHVQFDISKITLLDWDKAHSNEVHQLGYSVNKMVKTIDHQVKQLAELDEQRRQLLAHLSHDLRTPLASLQGYLEVISLKKHGPEQQALHLDIAMKNCSQLKSLIDQIFELAHLESGRTNVQFEVFNLGELLYDVMAKFAIRAEKLGVSLAIFPTECDIKAYSDIGKLERVLTNLIENALRHTNENGAISIEINQYGEHLTVAVKDTGVGISAKELPYIFEARYRASNAKGCKKSHAGLGLAITERLIKLLKTEIRVQSKVGVGTEFSFQLREAEPYI
ncbi:Sensor histidine kinase RcsC [Pseudoalteromonas holothuriae]|uniref:histidine kinase n=1 Tax=Pseudoalteromonas holothuriae TaxID=2963714 RepID=A0A9W4QRN0_9GAMM|nr:MULTISPECIES: HAMP domain-containing sensor histidine kinase [unclassified Pseudoalteromonas]CAH9050187.1 Sensor histidine kinase RcsC [Pseudoalteromonas sp. CIP111854]CAH9052582.1 Sensor histidine kinase RcsC [Pseudoalteromonas sp. CIP111951]